MYRQLSVHIGIKSVHTLVLCGIAQNGKIEQFVGRKIFDELSALTRLFDYFVTTEFAGFRGFDWRTIPRRFSREERQNNYLSFRLLDITTENSEIEI